jgi:peptidoglycan/xylan/chitin deacetylase (PgdA/CDA1 family)
MYHRFDENKYPSTNIKMEVFVKQIAMIKNANYEFYDIQEFIDNFNQPKNKKKILITIDDAFSSFYEIAWPFLKENRIPFILFVSTEPVGNKGYMTWDQIREIEQESYGYIGHHSHTHNYLIEKSEEDFIKDTEMASKIFLKELGYVPNLFSYPFGEYSKFMKDYISENFTFAFGQHSGVIDLNKDKYELPRFPINENYGELDRFKSIINFFPLEFKNLIPEEKKLTNKNNPPEFEVEFFENQKNLNNINCYSNEGNTWAKSNTNFLNNKLTIKFRDTFHSKKR